MTRDEFRDKVFAGRWHWDGFSKAGFIADLDAVLAVAIAAERERCVAVVKAAPMTEASCKCKCGDCGEMACQCCVDGACEMRNEIVRRMESLTR